MLIIGGREVEVPGLLGVNYQQDNRLRLSPNDWRLRTRDIWIRGLVWHTRMGLPVKVQPGAGPNIGWDLSVAQRFAKDDRPASCHVAIDADGSFGCFADLVKIATYHGNHTNDVTIGCEIYQDVNGNVFEASLKSAVLISDVITREIGIQRQFPRERGICRRIARPTEGETLATKLAFVEGGLRGRDFCGVYGHRNITRNRGPGDPGDKLFELFELAGYEPFHIDKSEDLSTWEHRQRQLGIDAEDCDGVPGQRTRRLISTKRHGGPGLWVVRPGDDADAVVVAE